MAAWPGIEIAGRPAGRRKSKESGVRHFVVFRRASQARTFIFVEKFNFFMVCPIKAKGGTDRPTDRPKGETADFLRPLDPVPLPWHT